MINPLIEGIKKTVSELIPDCVVKEFLFAKSRFIPPTGYVREAPYGKFGASFSNEKCQFWFDYNEQRICMFEIIREALPFSKTEKQIIGWLPNILPASLNPSFSRKQLLGQRVASRIGFEHVLISSILRGGKAATFWVPAFILLQLQELTYCTYEGAPCTSGFIFTAQPELYMNRLANLDYTFNKFTEKVTASEEYFAKTATFRYVDGKNSFYLIDNFLGIYGVIKVNEPERFNRIDRSNFKHLLPLVDHMPSRPWAACVGNNKDVNVIMPGDKHFLWQKNHWHLLERSLLKDLITRSGCNSETAEILTSVIFALSSLRMGSVMLIRRSDSLPNVIGSIDDSKLASALRASVLNKHVYDLTKDQSLLGILSSDGLTTFSVDGIVISCGDIIDISNAASQNISGGGRSQAAIAASFYGLAIKVSEDGPISIYEQGKRLLRL